MEAQGCERTRNKHRRAQARKSEIPRIGPDQESAPARRLPSVGLLGLDTISGQRRNTRSSVERFQNRAYRSGFAGQVAREGGQDPDYALRRRFRISDQSESEKAERRIR